MTPIQQLMLGVGASKKTYLDDVFSTYVYTGDDSSYRNINNGIDLAGEGGMVMVRPRNNTIGINLFDTARGASKRLHTDANYAESTDTSRLDQFNSNGFRVNGNYSTNGPSSYNYASWTFRKAPGFCDVVTYTGNGSANRQISHSLKSIPGLILIKRTNGTASWVVYHRSTGASKGLYLNSDSAAFNTSNCWNSTEPTASVFTVGNETWVNANNDEFVAYLFAGGESTNALARSVEFDGNDYLSLASTSDVAFGTGDFTVEAWVKTNDYTNAQYLLSLGDGDDFSCGITNSQWFYYNHSSGTKVGGTPVAGEWTHFAVARSSGAAKLFINGIERHSWSDSRNFSSSAIAIGRNNSSASYYWDGDISNLRIVKGTAVYTSSFRPPTEPLTNITNTKLLCCNNSSTTGSTVTPGTITANGDPTASSDSPFDDPAGFKFGESGSENVIKCGSYKGNSSTDGPEINLGFEPQWFMIKRTDSADEWVMYDSMRGIVSDGADARLYVNQNASETQGLDYFNLTPTGLKITRSSGEVNNSSGTYLYIAIRRPDPLVQKPQLATDVFNMVMGTSNSDVPAFVSGFVTDFAFNRIPTTTEDWWTQSRLTGDKYLRANSQDAQASSTANKWDYNNGWYGATSDQSTSQSWMWKRHAGFDVVATGPGKGSGEVIRHNLGRTPEMIWAKKRATSNWPGNSSDNYVLDNWFVWHKDANSSSVAGYLNTTGAGGLNMVFTGEVNSVGAKFHSNITYTNDKSLMLFFASVDGISKVGSYTGNGSSTGPTISLGFAPRFLIIKCSNNGGTNWFVYDTLRGLSSGNEQRLYLNTDGSQSSGDDITPSSTGFQLITAWDQLNANNDTYIYYAHA